MKTKPNRVHCRCKNCHRVFERKPPGRQFCSLACARAYASYVYERHKDRRHLLSEKERAALECKISGEPMRALARLWDCTGTYVTSILVGNAIARLEGTRGTNRKGGRGR